MTDKLSQRFRLETVLRVASSREEQLASEVGALERACRLEESRLESLRQVQQQALAEDSARHQQGVLHTAWLLQANRYADALVELIRAQTSCLEARLLELEGRRADLIAASQERRALEKLKERHRQRWQQRQDHLEMLQAAEVSTTRFVRRQAEGV